MNRFKNFNEVEREILEILLGGIGTPNTKKSIEIMKILFDELIAIREKKN
ncbi:MAG: hypothetical protein K0R18_2193 [Bacillales bacterium]|jgi:hypothetical protein|nr:hypothetical protein [Bacillales bacterium]